LNASLPSATGAGTDLFNLAIHAVYQSVQEADPWRSCLSLMAEYFQSASAALMVRSCASDPGYLVCIPAGDPAMEQAYRSEWYKSGPFIALPPDCVMLVSNHVMGVDIAAQAGTTALLRLHRFQHLPPFGSEDQQRLAMFVPHMKQAMMLTAHLNGNELQMKIYEEGLERLNIGVIVLDDTGQLVRANPTARQLLDSADGLRLAGRYLAAHTVDETRALQRLLAGAREHPKRVTAMCLSRPSGRRKLTAVVRGFPLAEGADGGHARPMVAIFLRDPDMAAEPAHDIARQLFDFTPAEAQLAIELLNGLSLDEAAGKLGILRNTGRAHLRAIFSKTGVTRQSELVRVLLNGVLALSTIEK
jgi:DNA-binding CsgD family transcriptional regulator/PAS domain-containing protein